ncbi:MAG: hypothetical protein JRJ60_22480 [Deltaproteobacteria bacterium]|nr:hypothetical protein [Deltaproteobacteria bacterium]
MKNGITRLVMIGFVLALFSIPQNAIAEDAKGFVPDKALCAKSRCEGVLQEGGSGGSHVHFGLEAL